MIEAATVCTQAATLCEQAQQAEAAELARKAEAPVIRLLLAAPGGGGLCYYLPHYLTVLSTLPSAVPYSLTIPPGGALLGTIQQGVGGSSEALAAVLDTLQARRLGLSPYV